MTDQILGPVVTTQDNGNHVTYNSSTGAIDNPAGAAAVARVGSTSRPTIAMFGHSYVQLGWYGWYVPWQRNESTSLSGINFTGMERKVASGAHTLNYSAATKTCSFDGGPATALVNGFQIIPGPTASTGCGITVKMDIL